MSVGQDGIIKIFNPSDGQLLKILEDHTDKINQILFKSESKFFSVSKTGEIYKWKIE